MDVFIGVLQIRIKMEDNTVATTVAIIILENDKDAFTLKNINKVKLSDIT